MPTEEQCRRAVQALYRVRAVEKPPGADGVREVWHRGGQAELLSCVDALGRLEEQEFTLYREVVLWRRGQGMRTGKLASDRDVSSHGNVTWDEQPSPVRLSRGNKALAAHDGGDEYLTHLRDAISAELAGLAWDDQRVVTNVYFPGDSQAHEVPELRSPLQRLLDALWELFRRR